MNETNKPDLEVVDDDHEGMAMWKGRRLMDMSNKELYIAFSELGKLYQKAKQDLEESENFID